MHLTARMAWHNNNWNGHICKDPESNTYCIGVHSLLSGRIEKNRDLDFEKGKLGYPLSRLEKDQIPPCYWSINAFGEETFKIDQGHAFKDIKEKIPETVGPYSFYTWPFRLSFNHSKSKKHKEGNYPPDLEKRIENFTKKFSPKKSVVFFYANYDNPVSADEMQYLLLGCSVIASQPKRTWFPFSEEFMEEWKQSGKKKGEKKANKMKNFPKINWALLCSHDPGSLALLPYREYLAYVEKNPEDEEKLKEMRVLIEEQSLVRGFKYVAMDIDDDKCLYLLYKLRKAIKKIQEHHQTVVKSDFAEEERRINKFIEMV
jgi:exodeoxyribonuclease V alpha subunit